MTASFTPDSIEWLAARVDKLNLDFVSSQAQPRLLIEAAAALRAYAQLLRQVEEMRVQIVQADSALEELQREGPKG